MTVVNLVAKFLIKPEIDGDSCEVEKGEVRVCGADDATAAILQTDRPELYAIPSLYGNQILCCSQNESMKLEDAFAIVTSYLNILDEQDFSVVSSFKDDIMESAGGENSYGYSLPRKL